MVTKIKELSKPEGFSRLVFRAPIWFYNAGLGWLLGGRFLLLEHTGRVSGLPRQTVLEVVKHDREGGIYYIASGFGEKSDWIKNITANPSVSVQAGRSRFPATAERLSPKAGEEVILEYGKLHPVAMRELARFMGYQIENTKTDLRELGRILPIFKLSPRSETED